MKQILFVLSVSLMLSGCGVLGSDLRTEAYSEDELYQGYPCGEDCQAFQAGFELAAAKEMMSFDECVSENEGEKIGCKAYVNEVQIESKGYDELMQGL